MSQTRQQATHIQETGAAQRGTWDPDPNSAHYRVYKWWQRKSARARRYIERENFCHYWRVVLIWAPLRWLVKPVLAFLGLCIVAAILWLAITKTSVVLGVLLSAASVLYFIFGLKVGQQLLHDLGGEDWEAEPVPGLDEQPTTVKALAVLATLPLQIFFAIAILVLGSILAFLYGLHDDYDIYRRTGRWFAHAKPGSTRLVSWVRPWEIFPLALLIASWWFTPALVVLLVLVVILLFFGVILGVSYLVTMNKEKTQERHKAQAAERRRREAEVVLKVMFEVMHPERAGNGWAFNAWLERYKRHCLVYFEQDAYDIESWSHVWHMSAHYQNCVWVRLNPVASHAKPWEMPPPEPPSRVFKAFVAVEDYLLLIWSVVKVKKWKICPWVEIH